MQFYSRTTFSCCITRSLQGTDGIWILVDKHGVFIQGISMPYSVNSSWSYSPYHFTWSNFRRPRYNHHLKFNIYVISRKSLARDIVCISRAHLRRVQPQQFISSYLHATRTESINHAMTSGIFKANIYPDYCHELSPTIGKWCPLRAINVHDLESVGMFIDGISPCHSLFS
jgi:hypothetical protein